MSEQIFISYRREGGDMTAKLICEALKNRGYSVFYYFDLLQSGHFDDRIYRAIEECNDFVLVLPPNALDRCVNEDDWVRLEIGHAIKFGKNIIPVMLPDFSFPENLPADIANIARINGVPFIMPFFDRTVIPAIIERFSTSAASSAQPAFISEPELKASKGLKFTLNEGGGYSVSKGKCTDTEIIIPRHFNGKPEPKASEGLKFTLNKNGGYSVSKGKCTDTEIIIPCHFNGKPVTKIGDQAFDGFSDLKSITIPNSVTAIGKYAFFECESLTSITIPNGVTSIGKHAFEDCGSLTSITIPNSVTAIGEDAFYDCKSLTSITIPNSIMSIGRYAFDYCNSLKSVSFNGTIDQWRKIIKNTKGKIIFPWHIKTVLCTDGDINIR